MSSFARRRKNARSSMKTAARPTKPVIKEGLRLTLDLSSTDDVVAYRALKTDIPIDLSKIAEYEAEKFWQPFSARELNGRLVLKPGDFYLLASKERVSIPLDFAAEMESYDPSIGEFTVHYAGFFDPGFGFGLDAEIKGTTAVLEVRAHELPIMLEDEREVGRLRLQDVRRTGKSLRRPHRLVLPETAALASQTVQEVRDRDAFGKSVAELTSRSPNQPSAFQPKATNIRGRRGAQHALLLVPNPTDRRDSRCR